MAGGILAILDQVVMLLDDTAVMSKVAAKEPGEGLAIQQLKKREHSPASLS